MKLRFKMQPPRQIKQLLKQVIALYGLPKSWPLVVLCRANVQHVLAAPSCDTSGVMCSHVSCERASAS